MIVESMGHFQGLARYARPRSRQNIEITGTNTSTPIVIALPLLCVMLYDYHTKISAEIRYLTIYLNATKSSRFCLFSAVLGKTTHDIVMQSILLCNSSPFYDPGTKCEARETCSCNCSILRNNTTISSQRNQAATTRRARLETEKKHAPRPELYRCAKIFCSPNSLNAQGYALGEMCQLGDIQTRSE